MLEILNFQNVNVAIFLIIYTEHFNVFANMTSVSVLGLPTTGRSMCLYTKNQNEVKFHTCRTMFIVSSLVYNQKINHIYFINIYIYIYILQHFILSIYLKVEEPVVIVLNTGFIGNIVLKVSCVANYET